MHDAFGVETVAGVENLLRSAFDGKDSTKLLNIKCDTPEMPGLSCLDADPTYCPTALGLP